MAENLFDEEKRVRIYPFERRRRVIRSEIWSRVDGAGRSRGLRPLRGRMVATGQRDSSSSRGRGKSLSRTANPYQPVRSRRQSENRDLAVTASAFDGLYCGGQPPWLFLDETEKQPLESESTGFAGPHKLAVVAWRDAILAR